MSRNYDLGHETHQQVVFVEWCELNRQKYPPLDSIYHVPNGEMRHPAIAAKLQSMGVKSGVPDLHLPFAAHGFHSLYIEMKRLVGGKLSKAQKEWRERLSSQGNLVVTCEGWEEAVKTTIEYLTPKP